MYREDLVTIDGEGAPIIGAVLAWLPSYKDLMALVGMWTTHFPRILQTYKTNEQSKKAKNIQNLS